jgi:DNA processing protein
MSQKIEKIEKENFNQSFLSSLLEIPDCPKEIYFQGKLESFLDRKNTKFVAIVGSRQHSNYGAQALEKIISELSGYNIVIVSGLALGIDSLAHKLALKYNLKTIAVPGSGLAEKVIYPRSNFSLAQNILKKNGLLLSEFEPNFKATP